MTELVRPLRNRDGLIGPATALALGALVIVAARWGPDWPAQEFRAWAATHEGLSVWTNRWYGGQALPSYSVLYPLVARTLGAGLTGLLAIVATAWAAADLAPAQPWRARCFQLTVAVGLTQNLLIGQVPFLMAAAFGLLAVRSLKLAQPWVLVALFATVSSLSSPMAGVFLLVAAPALGMTFGWRRAAGLAGALVGPAVSSLVGGAGGRFPCSWQTVAGVAVFCGLLALTARHNRALQCFAGCYLLVTIAMFVVPNPVGGNVSRLGKLIALPLACHVLVAVGRSRRVAAAAAALLAIAWPAVPFTSSIVRGAADPSQDQAFYGGLLGFLKTQDGNSGRIEIPFTREHWEALWVARSFPIARGWERQTDLEHNSVLYDPLDPGAYRRWLDDNSVSLVALPNVPIDYGGKAEVALLRAAPSYLRPVWHDSHWQVWRVLRARPIVSGAATLVHLGPASIVVRFRRAGTAMIRIRGSNLWQVRGGAGCVDSTPAGWLAVHARHQGTLTLDASISDQLIAQDHHCA